MISKRSAMSKSDAANRLISVNGQTSTTYAYGGLGDRHQKNGINYTLDLAVGLTQVLSDGANTYLYGNGRISQHTTQTEYYLTDALGSVRQLVDTAGAVTLTQSYAPYGETVSSVGSGASVYQYTGESRDANGLTYLRARYLDSSTGRFTQRDPSGLETNLYLYAGANPVNRIDPSGLFSIEDIANSYDLDKNQLLAAFSNGSYNSALEGRWGWLKLLLDADEGQNVHVGVPTIFPPFLNVTSSKQIVNDGCNILIGGKNLKSYTRFPLDTSFSPPIWWRNTKPNHYFLNGYEYLDAGRVLDLPDFRTLGGDSLPWLTAVAAFSPGTQPIAPYLALASQVVDFGGEVTLDRFGNVYFTAFGSVAPNIGGGAVSSMEGYIAKFGNIEERISGSSPGPSERTVAGTITGWCANADINLVFNNIGGGGCQNTGFYSAYGYSLGIGGFSYGASYGWQFPFKIEALAWDYIENKRGVSKSEVIQMLH